jgi:hypothetical protein
LDFSPILKNYRNAGRFAGRFAQLKSVLPGVKMQWRSGG